MEEILKQILSEIKDIKETVTGLQHDVIDIKENVTGLQHDVIDIKENVTGLQHDVVDLKDGQGRIEAKVDSLSTELRSNFKYILDKLDEHREVFDVVSDEIKGTKVDIEYLSSKTGRHDTELNKILNKLRG